VHLAELHSKKPLSGFSGARSAIIHRAVRCAPDMSGEPAEQRLTSANDRLPKVNSGEQCTAEFRAEKSERTPDSEQYLSGAPSDYLVCPSPAKPAYARK
jgi:hypothetical protein